MNVLFFSLTWVKIILIPLKVIQKSIEITYLMSFRV